MIKRMTRILNYLSYLSEQLGIVDSVIHWVRSVIGLPVGNCYFSFDTGVCVTGCSFGVD